MTLTTAELEEVDRNVAITKAAVELAKNMPVRDPLGNTEPSIDKIIKIGFDALVRADVTMRGAGEKAK